MAWAPDYATTAQLRDFLRIGDSDDDAELAFALSAASRAVDLHTHRQFGQVAPVAERVYPAYYDRRRCRWAVDIDDVQDITGLSVEVEGGVVDVFTLEPRNAAVKGYPFTLLVVDPASANKPTSGEPDVTVEALWGWSAVPTTVTQATLLQASRFHARRFSPFGIAGSVELGSEMRLQAQVDVDVGVALSPVMRWWSAA